MLISQARRFGETLIERHVLSRDDLEAALEEAEASNQPLPAVLLRAGLVGTKDLTAALAESLGVRFVDFQETPLHQDATTMVPHDVATHHLALGVDFEGHKLVVAFAEPADDEALAAVGAATGYEIIPAVADRSELVRAIEMVFGGAGDLSGEPSTMRVEVRETLASAQAALPTDGHGTELSINDLLQVVLGKVLAQRASHRVRPGLGNRRENKAVPVGNDHAALASGDVYDKQCARKPPRLHDDS